MKKIKEFLNTSLKTYLRLKIFKNKNHIFDLRISIPNKKNKKINFFIKFPLSFRLPLKINISKNGLQSKSKSSGQLMEALDLIKTINKEANSFSRAF